MVLYTYNFQLCKNKNKFFCLEVFSVSCFKKKEKYIIEIQL